MRNSMPEPQRQRHLYCFSRFNSLKQESVGISARLDVIMAPLKLHAWKRSLGCRSAPPFVTADVV